MEIKASQRRHHETSKGGRGDPGDNLKGYRIVLEVFLLQSWIATQSFALLSGDGFYLRATSGVVAWLNIDSTELIVQCLQGRHGEER